MTLLEKQQAFTRLVPRLLECVWGLGYETTFGETWRSDETAAIYAKEGKGSKTSLHRIRLAIDLNFYKDGRWLTDAPSYFEAGKFWEAQSMSNITCAWGGRWGDYVHFSIAHNGMR